MIERSNGHAASRGERHRERIEHTEGLHAHPRHDDGQLTQSLQVAAWYELGRAYARATDQLVEVARAFMDGYADEHLHPAERAIQEWQRHLAGMPRWRRWLVKLWYSL